MLEEGSLVDGKYKILRRIGQGGMSVVYLALNEKANKTWAIKEVRKDGSQNNETVTNNLVAETNILTSLNHPGIVSIVDVIDTNDTFLVVMDYIEGNGLDKALRDYGAQPEDLVIDWAKQLCSILGYLHSKGIIYRDLKPANIMLKPDGDLVLIDFGTAKTFKGSGRLQDTTCLGTIGYAAPEQYGGRGESDARTDIYTLGATLYHLVTGSDPTVELHMTPIREKNYLLSEGLETVILKCTEVQPENRYQSCAELLYDLDNLGTLGEIYRKEQKKKLSWFVTSCALSAVFLAASLGFRAGANSTQENLYDECIVAAEKRSSFSETEQQYKKAIKLDPTRSEAYLGLIKYYQEKNDEAYPQDRMLFTQGEMAFLEQTFAGNSDRLRARDIAGWSEVQFNTGILYYYCGGNDGKGDQEHAIPYFRNVVDSGALGDKDINSAQALLDICNAETAVADITGRTDVDYVELWDDLNSIAGGNLQDLNNLDIQMDTLYICRTFLSMIYKESYHFRNAGISYETVTGKINEIETLMQSPNYQFTEREATLLTLSNEVKEMLGYIRGSVDNAYGRGGAQ